MYVRTHRQTNGQTGGHLRPALLGRLSQCRFILKINVKSIMMIMTITTDYDYNYYDYYY